MIYTSGWTFFNTARTVIGVESVIRLVSDCAGVSVVVALRSDILEGATE